jgi:hypothetical protein
MEKDFCQALLEDDRKALQPLVNAFLGTLDVQDDPNSNWLKIKEWVERNDCVDHVKIVNGMLRTEPPIKEFIIQLKTTSAEKAQQKDIGITVFSNKFEFNFK